MEKKLEVKVVLQNEIENQKSPDSIHVEDGRTYFIYAPKEFLEDSLAKIQLGSLAMNLIKSAEQANYFIPEITFKYNKK